MNISPRPPRGCAAPSPSSEALKPCPACHALGYEHDLHCSRCGGALGPTCGRCGAPIAHPVAFYCARCGERLTPDDAND